ncbi:MAG TPA: hypothetical protein VFZ87_14015 [Gemmatimonadales bacterium]
MIGRSLRVGAFALLLSMSSGCVRPDYAESWPDGLFLSAGPQPGYGIKRLIEKQHPATLMADDGSVCRTSRERFDRAKEGRWIACVWNLPVIDSAPTIKPEDRSDGRSIAARN